MKRLLITAALAVLWTASASAAGPTEVIRSATDKILAGLNAPDMQGPAKKAARVQHVRKAMAGHFAWEESARRCLGRHWKDRTPAEKSEFTQLFSGFLQDKYAEQIATYYNNLDKINYQGEKIVEGSYAQVRVSMILKNRVDHPVEYRMQLMGGEWRVYDVVIEGVSLVKNYNDQFNAIIVKSGFDGLLKELRTKK